MLYPKAVKGKLKILDAYTENKDLTEFHIIHMYPKELAYPDGYYDARFFEFVIFNTDTMEKAHLGERYDSISFEDCIIARASIFADGAFLISLAHKAWIHNVLTQTIYIHNAE